RRVLARVAGSVHAVRAEAAIVAIVVRPGFGQDLPGAAVRLAAVAAQLTTDLDQRGGRVVRLQPVHHGVHAVALGDAGQVEAGATGLQRPLSPLVEEHPLPAGSRARRGQRLRVRHASATPEGAEAPGL